MSFWKPLIIAGSLALGASTVSAQEIGVPSGTYVNDVTHTNLLWGVNHFGLSTYYGRFDTISATLELNADDVSASSLEVTIDPKSVDVNYPVEGQSFAEELASPMFFDADAFNTITFKSTSIDLVDETTGTVTGDLTFHGVTKPVTLDVTLNAALPEHPMTQQPALGFSATTTIDRTEFGVDALAGPIGEEVKLIIEAEFVPQQQ